MRPHQLARTEPEKFIQIEKMFAGRAATALFRTFTESAPAIPPFCIPTSIATVRASASPRRVKSPTRRVSQ